MAVFQPAISRNLPTMVEQGTALPTYNIYRPLDLDAKLDYELLPEDVPRYMASHFQGTHVTVSTRLWQL